MTSADEDGRLRRSAHGWLEFLRTQELLRRFLPAPPARIVDVGGGTGVHARGLAAEGYRVSLVDVVPAHVERAGRIPGVEASLGDARDLAEADGSVEAVLLLGPLYHLREREDRVRALVEARQVVRPGGALGAVDLDRAGALLADAARCARIVETHSAMIAVSAHLLAIASVPDGAVERSQRSPSGANQGIAIERPDNSHALTGGESWSCWAGWPNEDSLLGATSF
jgi:SAM-dependent methyltransferase